VSGFGNNDPILKPETCLLTTDHYYESSPNTATRCRRNDKTHSVEQSAFTRRKLGSMGVSLKDGEEANQHRGCHKRRAHLERHRNARRSWGRPLGGTENWPAEIAR